MKKILFLVSLITTGLVACKKQPIRTSETTIDSVLTLSKNIGLSNQGVNHSTSNVKLFSWVFQNQNMTDSVQIIRATIVLLGNPSLIASLRINEGGEVVTAPEKTNIFSLNAIVVSGAVKTIDVFATTLSTEDTISATLVLEGVNKKTGKKFITNIAKGQTVSITSAVLSKPVFIPNSSSVAQYIACGSDGVNNGSKAVFWFSAEKSSLVITELKFTIQQPQAHISWLRIGAVSVPVVGNVAYFSGVSISVPFGGIGTFVEVFISYSAVGINGAPSGTPSSISLTQVKYNRAGSSEVRLFTDITSPSMRSVGSVPSLSLIQEGGPLVVGVTHVGSITVGAHQKGDIALHELSLQFQTVVTTIDATDVFILDDTNTKITGIAGSLNQQGVITLTFFGGYKIPAGTIKKLRVFCKVLSIGAPGTASVGVRILKNNLFSWRDIAGNATINETGTALFYSWPENIVTIRN